MFRPRQSERDASSAHARSDVRAAEPAGALYDQLRHSKGPRVSTNLRKGDLRPASDLPARTEGGTESRTEIHAAQPAALLPGLAHLNLLGIDDFVAWTLRFKWLIAGCVALCMAVALAYALTATPRYTVYTEIVVDPADLNVVTDDVFSSSLQRDAQILEAESKLRVLTSRNVLSRVIDRLNLTEDPEFVKTSLLTRLMTAIGISPPAGDPKIGVLRALTERVVARREERSFVVVLAVWSEEPQKAITLSEAITDAFEEELFHSAASSVGRVADNLKRRLDEMRQNVTDAERRVEEFRRANGLQSGAAGELMSNQQSSTLNTQVLEAQQRFIQAQTRYDQMKTAMDRGSANSAAIFDSETMTNLRAQYGTLQQEIGSLVQTYGPKHSRLINARSSQATLRTAIDNEARRILELARATLANEKQAFDALRGKASDKQTSVFTENAAEIQLRDLQRDARSKAALYESYLARAQQVTEREQIDTSNVRVISRPLPPNARSWPPRTLILLAAGAVAGLALGLGAALAFGFWQFLRMPPVGRARPVMA